jgi:phage/plasmid-associated DNA primase
MPFFPGAFQGGKPTDFNDLHVLMGLEEVRRQLGEFLPEEGKETLPAPPEKAVKAQKPNEGRLVDQLLSCYGPNLLMYGQDYFFFVNTHWVHMDKDAGAIRIKAHFDKLAKGLYNSRDIQGAYNRFLIRVPRTEHKMFTPNPYAQNFKNGTLYALPTLEGKFKLEFKPRHTREDLLIHCLDFDYDPMAKPSEDLDAMLHRMWDGDADIDQKIKCYYQFLGAALMPVGRKVALFVGAPGSGKSQLIALALQVVPERYISQVGPTDFYGFRTAPMLGKLVNYDTDINVTVPIRDDILKKIEDGSGFSYQRKNKEEILAPLPAVHLFGAQRMPHSKETSDAYNRRFAAFSCNRSLPRGEQTKDFGPLIFKRNPQGILVRGLQGLQMLCDSGGHFQEMDSSVQMLLDWNRSKRDYIQVFLEEVEEEQILVGNDKLLKGPGRTISKTSLWNAYSEWSAKNAPRNCQIGKSEFDYSMKLAGFKECRIHNVRHYSGIGTGIGKDSIM